MEVDLHEVSAKCAAVNWPSKSSVLETPERKRFQHSSSFIDSGLGSSLYSSPPEAVLMKPSKTSPLLRTPTDRSGRSADNFCCNATPSPIKSFVHMSSYSSFFSSPEVRKCSLSKHELRLSNPENATGYQFSGNSLNKNCGSPINVGSGDLITHSRPLSVKQYHFTAPSTSRVANRALNLPLPSRNCGIENDETAADVTLPYAIPETPSKGLGFDSIDRSMFGVDDFPDIATSTPLRDISDNHLDIMSFHGVYPRIYEQPSGPLESSICDSIETSVPVTGMFVSPSKITLTSSMHPIERLRYYDQSESISKEDASDQSKQDSYSGRSRSFEDDAYSNNDLPKMIEANSYDSKPFRPPVKPLKPFSRLWAQITFGETKHQREVTRYAHSFFESHPPSSLP